MRLNTFTPAFKPFIFYSSRLYRLLKNSALNCFVSGHDFSRADKLIISDLSRL